MPARHFDETLYPDKELTGRIIGAFYYVYHSLGYGFLESVYRRSMAVELRHRGIAVSQEVPFEIKHREIVTGVYRADLIAEGRIILETKTGTVLDPASAPQTLNYLRGSRLQIGLILHFGPTPAVKRIIASNYSYRDYSSRHIQRLEQDRAKAEGG